VLPDHGSGALQHERPGCGRTPPPHPSRHRRPVLKGSKPLHSRGFTLRRPSPWIQRGVALGAVDRLGQPSLAPGVGVEALVDANLPRVLATVTHGSFSHDRRTLRPRSWASHGQLMGRFEDNGSAAEGEAAGQQPVLWSGRRDSNPRPPPCNCMVVVSCVSASVSSAPELHVLGTLVSFVSADRWSRLDFVGDFVGASPATGRLRRAPMTVTNGS
jgi:hypothetical protein